MPKYGFDLLNDRATPGFLWLFIEDILLNRSNPLKWLLHLSRFSIGCWDPKLHLDRIYAFYIAQRMGFS